MKVPCRHFWLKATFTNLCPTLPHRVCCEMASALSQGLIALLTTANCTDDSFRKWLLDNEITGPDGLGLLAASETALEDKVFPMLQAAGVNMKK